MEELMSYVRAAVQKYNMIEDGDKIAVGISGGKDSLFLLLVAVVVIVVISIIIHIRHL